jgi:Cupin superfamily protein
MELPPQLRELRDFYYKVALKLPAEKAFVHAARVIERPTFFTLEHLKAHLNSPMLMPDYFALYWQGKRVDCASAVARKVVQGVDVPFLNKGILEDYLSHGASLVLEGLDILEPTINEMCAAIDAVHECVFSNCVAFFSQKGNEAYRGHRDTDDVLVVHLAGEKKWRIHERQAPRWVELFDLPPESMGSLQAEVLMRPGDALFIRSGTPHQVETVTDYSLHMSFDLCDRHVNAETALHLLLEEYRKDSAATYTPTDGVVGKLVTQAGTDAYKRRLAELQAAQGENYRRSRQMLGANRVRALDKWIAAEQKK